MMCSSIPFKWESYLDAMKICWNIFVQDNMTTKSRKIQWLPIFTVCLPGTIWLRNHHMPWLTSTLFSVYCCWSIWLTLVWSPVHSPNHTLMTAADMLTCNFHHRKCTEHASWKTSAKVLCSILLSLHTPLSGVSALYVRSSQHIPHIVSRWRVEEWFAKSCVLPEPAHYCFHIS